MTGSSSDLFQSDETSSIAGHGADARSSDRSDSTDTSSDQAPKVARRFDEVPARIYHYTSAVGLVGIIKNREIWATASNCLNDPTEISYASRVLVALLENRAEVDRDATDELRSKIALAVSLLKRSYNDPNSPDQYHEDHSFITSFSGSDRSLTLWRLYARQNGYSIGFDCRRLLEWLGEEDPGDNREDIHLDDSERRAAIKENFFLVPRLQEVQYGSVPVHSILEEVLSLPFDKGDSRGYESMLRSVFRRLSSVKHEAYADEREVRLVVQDEYHIPYSYTRVTAAGELAAYRKVVFPFEAVRSITIAPGANVPKVRRALRSLLSTGGRGAWEHVEVRECDIPFAWG